MRVFVSYPQIVESVTPKFNSRLGFGPNCAVTDRTISENIDSSNSGVTASRIKQFG